jgi:hypothetical protein
MDSSAVMQIGCCFNKIHAVPKGNKCKACYTKDWFKLKASIWSFFLTFSYVARKSKYRSYENQSWDLYILNLHKNEQEVLGTNCLLLLDVVWAV